MHYSWKPPAEITAYMSDSERAYAVDRYWICKDSDICPMCNGKPRHETVILSIKQIWQCPRCEGTGKYEYESGR